MKKKFLVTGIITAKKDGTKYLSGLMYNEKNSSWSQRASKDGFSNYLVPCDNPEYYAPHIVEGLVIEVEAVEFSAAGYPVWGIA